MASMSHTGEDDEDYEADDDVMEGEEDTLRGTSRDSLIKTEIEPPLSIRSISHSSLSMTISTLDGPLKTPKAEGTSIKFRPNLSAASLSSTRASSRMSTPTGASSFDIVSMLAHSVQLKFQSEQQRLGKDSLQKGIAGSLGARGGGGPKHVDVAAQKLQNQMANRLKKKLKKASGASRSKHLMELSWADDKAQELISYRPISLPYVFREGDDGEEGEAASTSPNMQRTKRPRVKIVDEANRNAAALFAEKSQRHLSSFDDEDDDARDWFLIQMPLVLPAISKSAMDTQREKLERGKAVDSESGALTSPSTPSVSARSKNKKRRNEKHLMEQDEEDQASTSAPSILTGLPEGRLGKLRIHASGRVRLWMGGHSFDVNQGSECNYAQDIGCLVESNSEFLFLGPCRKRMTVVPDVERMIEMTRPAFMDRV